jgi:hypothetical protein
VHPEDLRGRVVIVSFVFARCHDTCPAVTARLARAQAAAGAAGLGSAIHFVSITLDPATDTPTELREYAARFGADTHTWDFLTGDPAEVARVVRDCGVVTAAEGRGLGHTSPVLFVNPRGEIVGREAGADLTAMRILERARRLVSGPASAYDARWRPEGGRRGRTRWTFVSCSWSSTPPCTRPPSAATRCRRRSGRSPASATSRCACVRGKT